MKSKINFKIFKSKRNIVLAVIFICLLLVIPVFLIIFNCNRGQCQNNRKETLSKKCNCGQRNIDGFSSEENTSFDEKELNSEDFNNRLLNYPMIKNFVYPKCNFENLATGQKCIWIYKDTMVENMDRKFMMWSASLISEKNENEKSFSDIDLDHYITEKEMKNNYTKIFGPDTEYLKGTIDDWDHLCSYPGLYDFEDERYYIFDGCGGEYFHDIDSYSAPYKVEMLGDDIHVYSHFVYYIILFNDSPYYYFFNNYPKEDDYEFNDDYQIISNSVISENSNLEGDFKELISENKLKTYKYTFKKQSDGNYYFHSGKLQ